MPVFKFMAQADIATINDLLSPISASLQESQTILEEMLTVEYSTTGMPVEEQMVHLQQVLQFRLNCEDNLALILKIDQTLLEFLGIQPTNSAKMNFERLSYAIGNEDLKQILNILSILLGSFTKLAARYRKQQHNCLNKKQIFYPNNRFGQQLDKLLSQHKKSTDLLQTADHQINLLLKQQGSGPLFDHIAALRGPISQFHQAIMHGLGGAKQLYRKINHTKQLPQEVEHLVNTIHSSLISSSYTLKPKPDPRAHDKNLYKNTPEQLEKRAASKRLRPFFA